MRASATSHLDLLCHRQVRKVNTKSRRKRKKDKDRKKKEDAHHSDGEDDDVTDVEETPTRTATLPDPAPPTPASPTTSTRGATNATKSDSSAASASTTSPRALGVSSMTKGSPVQIMANIASKVSSQSASLGATPRSVQQAIASSAINSRPATSTDLIKASPRTQKQWGSLGLDLGGGSGATCVTYIEEGHNGQVTIPAQLMPNGEYIGFDVIEGAIQLATEVRKKPSYRAKDDVRPYVTTIAGKFNDAEAFVAGRIDASTGIDIRNYAVIGPDEVKFLPKTEVDPLFLAMGTLKFPEKSVVLRKVKQVTSSTKQPPRHIYSHAQPCPPELKAQEQRHLQPAQIGQSYPRNLSCPAHGHTGRWLTDDDKGTRVSATLAADGTLIPQDAMTAALGLAEQCGQDEMKRKSIQQQNHDEICDCCRYEYEHGEDIEMVGYVTTIGGDQEDVKRYGAGETQLASRLDIRHYEVLGPDEVRIVPHEEGKEWVLPIGVVPTIPDGSSGDYSISSKKNKQKTNKEGHKLEWRNGKWMDADPKHIFAHVRARPRAGGAAKATTSSRAPASNQVAATSQPPVALPITSRPYPDNPSIIAAGSLGIKNWAQIQDKWERLRLPGGGAGASSLRFYIVVDDGGTKLPATLTANDEYVPLGAIEQAISAAIEIRRKTTYRIEEDVRPYVTTIAGKKKDAESFAAGEVELLPILGVRNYAVVGPCELKLLPETEVDLDLLAAGGVDWWRWNEDDYDERAIIVGKEQSISIGGVQRHIYAHARPAPVKAKPTTPAKLAGDVDHRNSDCESHEDAEVDAQLEVDSLANMREILAVMRQRNIASKGGPEGVDTMNQILDTIERVSVEHVAKKRRDEKIKKDKEKDDSLEQVLEKVQSKAAVMGMSNIKKSTGAKQTKSNSSGTKPAAAAGAAAAPSYAPVTMATLRNGSATAENTISIKPSSRTASNASSCPSITQRNSTRPARLAALGIPASVTPLELSKQLKFLMIRDMLEGPSRSATWRALRRESA
ncbi:hypothetical protein BDZ90DRAFT_280719 [Jaminaea rosea]|uniref:Uncharacterized protein n=1 Tax=Jaminaea rosea TaxID=1569628 RepID=A0A316UQP1_9BASI|nr:hypothetical protein BDZ90DRAFT_280719 [Jaminaea rosea]PWN26183.1 hypothetical protein BDZ90DRAFT_280719 [Jaminaea rosea]